MAELVDAYVSGAYIERCAGSTPVRGTQKTKADFWSAFSFLFPLHPWERSRKDLRERRLKLHVFLFDGVVEAKLVGMQTQATQRVVVGI